MDNKIVFIKSELTVLRPICEADLPMLLQWVNDPDVQQFFSFRKPQMESTEREWLSRLAKDMAECKNMAFMIEALDSGKAIGTMSLNRINLRDRHATTGALIGDQKYRNRGYGVASKMHLLKYAFHELNLNRVNSDVVDGNDRSMAYSQRCGYVIEGRRRNMVFKNGEYRDLITLGVLREEWEKAFAAYQEALKR